MAMKNYSLTKDLNRKKSITEKFLSKGKGQSKDKSKEAEIIVDVRATIGSKNKVIEQQPVFTQSRLQDAIIWSEILGKPVSKRRKRYPYGN